jgi:signal transduction histidine kinase
LPLLFSEFRRLKTAAATEGSGLGLYIVKNIVKGHGGTVEVESDLGRGATFILRFPAVGTFAPATVTQAS